MRFALAFFPILWMTACAVIPERVSQAEFRSSLCAEHGCDPEAERPACDLLTADTTGAAPLAFTPHDVQIESLVGTLDPDSASAWVPLQGIEPDAYWLYDDSGYHCGFYCGTTGVVAVRGCTAVADGLITIYN